MQHVSTLCLVFSWSLPIDLENVDFVICQAQNAALEAQANTELVERIKTLEQEVARYKEDSAKAQAEVDRLLEILREMENEKNDKDKKINELERWVETCMKLIWKVFLKEAHPSSHSHIFTYFCLIIFGAAYLL